MKTFSCRWFDANVESGAISVFTGLGIAKSLDEVHFYIDEDAVEKAAGEVRAMLDDLAKNSERARARVLRSIDEGLENEASTVLSFARIHREEVDLFSAAQSDSFALAALCLRGVGVHADPKHGFTMNIDLGYSRDISDELLVVTFSPACEILGVSHES